MTTTASPIPRRKRIACVQLDSKHAQVARNTQTVLALVSNLISEAQTTPIDLLVLPELALSGYVFESKHEIEPLLEDARIFQASPSAANASTGLSAQSASAFVASCQALCGSSKHPSLTLAAQLAQYLRCHVVIGFPELGLHRQSGDRISATNTASSPFDARPDDVRSAESSVETKSADATQDRAFNSAALFAPNGSLLHVFRKHFLFESDDVWASEGRGFEAIHLPGLGNVCVAICMDLNPYKFRTAFDSCELASFCVENEVDLLVMPMAWLLPKDEQDKASHQATSSSRPAPSLSTVNYWALRCLPLFEKDRSSGANSEASRVRYLVANNRTGIEATSTFAGSSSVLQMKLGERPMLLDALGTTEQACLVVELPE